VPSTDRAGRRRGPASLPATLAVRDWRRQTPVRACNVLSDSVGTDPRRGASVSIGDRLLMTSPAASLVVIVVFYLPLLI